MQCLCFLFLSRGPTNHQKMMDVCVCVFFLYVLLAKKGGFAFADPASPGFAEDNG